MSISGLHGFLGVLAMFSGQVRLGTILSNGKGALSELAPLPGQGQTSSRGFWFKDLNQADLHRAKFPSQTAPPTWLLGWQKLLRITT